MLRKIFAPHTLPSSLLYLWKFQSYRKWWGGHWELWWIDCGVYSAIWHDVKTCSLVNKEYPSGCLRGTPTCEDYPIK